MLWFIDLTVATCHIQYTFLSLCQKMFHKKMDKAQECSMSTIFVWYENGCQRLLGVQSIYTEGKTMVLVWGNLYDFNVYLAGYSTAANARVLRTLRHPCMLQWFFDLHSIFALWFTRVNPKSFINILLCPPLLFAFKYDGETGVFAYAKVSNQIVYPNKYYLYIVYYNCLLYRQPLPCSPSKWINYWRP